jgi:hypothetical protein
MFNNLIIRPGIKMNIQKQLPQFNKQTALLIVTGSQKGVFYLAAAGVIEEISAVDEPVEKYSDREEFFASKGGEGGYTSGAVYEADKQEHIKQFAKKINGEADRIVQEKGIDTVYLFVPDFVIHEFNRTLTSRVKDMVQEKFKGNFVEAHPFKLLEKIKKLKF